MVSRSSHPSSEGPDDARRAGVFPHVDRAQRIVAMLDRWQNEDQSDEPDWDVDQIESLAMRPHST